jgi:hypothetical protein
MNRPVAKPHGKSGAEALLEKSAQVIQKYILSLGEPDPADRAEVERFQVL